MTTIWDADMDLRDALGKVEYDDALIEAIMNCENQSRKEALETLKEEYRGAFEDAAAFARFFVDSLEDFPDFLEDFIDYESLGRWLLRAGPYWSLLVEDKMHVFRRI